MVNLLLAVVSCTLVGISACLYLPGPSVDVDSHVVRGLSTAASGALSKKIKLLRSDISVAAHSKRLHLRRHPI